MDAFSLKPAWQKCSLVCLGWLWCCVTATYAADPFADRSSGTLSSFDIVEEDSEPAIVKPQEGAELQEWQPQGEAEPFQDNLVKWNDPSVKPIDWVRHFGLRHSSADGRHLGKGIPLEGTSWLNRPYHADWFVGSLLGDNLTDSVRQNNELFGGVRIGFDFDYYWGLDWRFGWADPNMAVDGVDERSPTGSYFASDIDLKYYPWGDAKIRPYGLLGVGLARVSFRNEDDFGQGVNLATMPWGVGIEFPQWPWLAWRLEVIDNLAFGADGVQTLNNFAITAGMEWRFGAKPNSYWPWRSSRRVW